VAQRRSGRDAGALKSPTTPSFQRRLRRAGPLAQGRGRHDLPSPAPPVRAPCRRPHHPRRAPMIWDIAGAWQALSAVRHGSVV
jgi:hypothetical protein